MTSTWTNGLGEGTAPPHWVRDADGHHYVARAKLRSQAVVKFEIARDPERTEGEIARAAHTSIGAVRNARKEVAA